MYFDARCVCMCNNSSFIISVCKNNKMVVIFTLLCFWNIIKWINPILQFFWWMNSSNWPLRGIPLDWRWICHCSWIFVCVPVADIRIHFMNGRIFEKSDWKEITPSQTFANHTTFTVHTKTPNFWNSEFP